MTNLNPVSVAYDGDVAWVTVDSPPVNATSTAVRSGLLAAVSKVQDSRVAILICAGKTFIAGGDMSEFDHEPAAPHLPDVVQAIEDSATPFIAAMHGHVLGGGFEIAMGCAWRIAQASTRFGLPEVSVGLVAGAGGTQRLPRLIGMEAAAEVACSGRPIPAIKLHQLDGLDECVDGDLRAAAARFADNLPSRPDAVRNRKAAPLSSTAARTLRANVETKAKGQAAPALNFDAIQWATEPFSVGQQKERALHLRLRQSDESRALRYAFFAQRKVSKPAAIDAVAPRSVEKIAVVGGGLMGAGIAANCLLSGLQVTLIEINEQAVKGAAGRVQSALQGAHDRKKISAEQLAQFKSAFAASSDFKDVANVDVAIEAVFEDLAAKREVFRKLADVVDEKAILATNTSYLDPTEIFEGIQGQQRCIGLHFFSPAHIMRLLEIVNLPATNNETLATGFALARVLGKVGVLSGICDGFIGNRMLAAYRRQADYLLADGALPYQIDAAMRRFGMPMGPYELQDLTGLQIAWANRQRQAPLRAKTERYVDIADQLCEQDRLGQRSGRGWYRYAAGNRTPIRDPDTEAMITAYSKSHGINRRSFTEVEISQRLIAVLINEGWSICEEAISEGPEAVDMVQIHGYGFPRWRGGPLHYGNSIGVKNVASTMNDVAAQSPNSWTIAKELS